jgi:hypothetical protein
MDHELVFKHAKVPDPDDLQGYYAVKLVTSWTPDIRFFGQKKYFPQNVAREGGGYNYLFDRIRLGNFRIEVGPSAFGDGLQVMKIIYDHPSNPGILSRLTDEVRQVGTGYYFCRGIYDFFGRPKNVMYFTLTKLPNG